MMRTVGVLLLIGAVVVCLIAGALLAAGVQSGQTQVTGAILGFGLVIVVLVGPLAAGGVIVLAKGRADRRTEREAEALRKILNLVQARGQVDVSDVIIELNADLPSVKNMIYKLVGMGVFSGYINWDEGKLYSAEASALREMSVCKRCGGSVSFAGKGVIRCPFCGTEYFLAS